MKINSTKVAELVFQTCPSYKKVWQGPNLGFAAIQEHSRWIMLGLAKHVANLWYRRRFSEFGSIFDLIERLHHEGTREVVDHLLFYFTQTLYLELKSYGIHPRFMERRLGPQTSQGLDFIKQALDWH